MFHGFFLLYGMFGSLMAGAIGDGPWFLVSVGSFVVSVILAKLEKNPEWLRVISFILVWLGATGGMTWEFIKWPLMTVGGVWGIFSWIQIWNTKKQKP